MPQPLFVAAAAAVLAIAPMLSAQSAPPMLATERYLFVVREDVLYQFDISTLAVLHTFHFPASQFPAGQVAIEAAPATPPPTATKRAGGVGPATRPARAPIPTEPASPLDVATSLHASLQWLIRHQDEDGKWDCDQFMKHDDGAAGEVCDGPGNAVHDVGVTGLAMLAMLGSGSTMRSGPYREPLKMAVKWLREQQQENGLFGQNASHDFIYDHAIAAYAISEAYGLSNYKMLQPTAQKGVDYLESHRNPYAVWRYQPRDNDNDTSVTTWAVLAMKSADAFGLRVNKAALQMASTWYDQVTTDDGRAGYTKAGERSSRMPGDHAQRFPVENEEAMTAAAMVGRFVLGASPEQKPVMTTSADVIAKRLPRWETGFVDPVYWYFGTYAMYQMGGDYWTTWNRALGTLVAHQRNDGNFAGSWDPVGVWDETGGRVFATALYALSLDACARAGRTKK